VGIDLPEQLSLSWRTLVFRRGSGGLLHVEIPFKLLMNVLVLNAGSSSVKFAVVSTDGSSQNLAKGAVKGIGKHAVLTFVVDGKEQSLEGPIPNHEEAFRWIFEQLRAPGASDVATSSLPSLLAATEAIGHRIVHGGDRFRAAVLIDDAALAEIHRLTELAPLHTPAGVAGIRAARATLGPKMPNVAVFDTAFHHDMPPRASTYAIPEDLAARHRIRRYGFHGIAHASLVAAFGASLDPRPADLRLVLLHLGSGCSAAAVRGGHSLDTSMGFTPLEGLVMNTRSGDLDPALVAYLARREGVDVDEVERWLNERSGLLGISGRSTDVNDLLTAADQEGDARAVLAVDVFCYRARKYLGAYLATLGGADAVIFGGGIGEHVPTIRARICEGMEWCGLTIDKERNRRAVDVSVGVVARISPDDATLPAFVVPVDEETWIARETMECLRAKR
jgi:acetate kinase